MLAMTSRRTVFSSHQAAQAAGVTYRQLDYWVRQGLVRPSYGEARGSGTSRRFAASDLLALRVVSVLMPHGVGLDAIRRAVEMLRWSGADFLWVKDGRVGLGDVEDMLPALQEFGELVVVHLAQFRDELAAA